MQIEIISENTVFDDVSSATRELAFCHYPVTVEVAGSTETFESFDAALAFVKDNIQETSKI